MIRIRRIYDPALEDEGTVYLVDRLWPRGVKKEALSTDGWLKDLAPSNELRSRFHHDPALWDAFRESYFAELDQKPEQWQPLVEAARRGNVTLLYAARDREYNNAEALRQYLERHL